MQTTPSLESRYHSLGNRQAGIGLIEVLAAVVIISIGFLAVAKMQVEGMRFSQSAYFNAQANLMLKDITDRMRSNRQGVGDGAYDDAETAASLTMPACVASVLPCTPAELAQKDLFEWSSYLHAPDGALNYVPTLPHNASNPAKGTITKNLDVYDIAVQWSEKIDGTTQTQTRSVQFIP